MGKSMEQREGWCLGSPGGGCVSLEGGRAGEAVGGGGFGGRRKDRRGGWRGGRGRERTQVREEEAGRREEKGGGGGPDVSQLPHLQT